MEKILSIVLACAKKVAALYRIALPDDLDVRTPLTGRQGVFDSLAMVSLVVSVELELEDCCGKPVTLTDRQAFSQSHSPFLSIESLAHYAHQRLAKPAEAA